MFVGDGVFTLSHVVAHFNKGEIMRKTYKQAIIVGGLLVTSGQMDLGSAYAMEAKFPSTQSTATQLSHRQKLDNFINDLIEENPGATVDIELTKATLPH